MARHAITVGTKRQADAASTETLFRPVNGHTATRKVKYCNGRYANNLRGREINAPDDVVAVWTERRKDAEGPYWTMYAYKV